MKKLLFVALTAFAGSAMAADLHPTCQDYFKQIEALGNNGQLPAEVKAQLEGSKAQFAQLPAAAQEQSCKQALDMLKQMAPAK